jgi:hypothetical protein
MLRRERRILRLSASLAGGIPVSLRDTVTGLDDDNTARLIVAIRHAAGNDREQRIPMAATFSQLPRFHLVPARKPGRAPS